jgi:membrane protease YdiL (CAAX protease family)
MYRYGFTWAHLIYDWQWYYLPFILVGYLWLIPAFPFIKDFKKEFVLDKSYYIGLLLTFGITIGLGVIFHSVLPSNPLSYILTALTFSVSGAFVEEPIFRGMIMKIFEKRHGFFIALMGQSLLFGLTHLWAIENVLSSFVFGIFLGIIRKYLGLPSTMTLHFAINLITHNLT